MNFWYHLCWWLCRIGLFFWHPVFHVTGREQIPAGSCIFCANHSGMADPIWILLALPEKKMIRIMAKQELRRVPFIGWVMEKFRVIFVNRGAHDIAAYQQCVDALEQEREALIDAYATAAFEQQKHSRTYHHFSQFIAEHLSVAFESDPEAELELLQAQVRELQGLQGERQQQAAQFHAMGYNCAQSVACAFADKVDLDKVALFKVTEGLGLGMGGMNGTCGAISAAAVLAGKTQHRPCFIIGKDTRISGYMLESALEAGLSAAGLKAILMGPMPTPAVAYLTRTFRAEAGIVISASHNPYYDNGIKFFSADGTKLPDDVELAIEAELDNELKCVESAELGKAQRIDDAAGRYIEFCKSTFPSNLSLEGLKMVVDCGHGATYHIAPSVFRELGAEVIAIGCSPDGLNINDGVGSTAPEALAAKVQECKADLGVAFDGDGDRLVMVDSTGYIIDGDEILYIIARDALRHGRLKGGVVGTLMANMGLELALQTLGIPFARAKVGDRYVLEMMNEKGWRIGGENSGHIICLDQTTTGDGIVAALQVLTAMRSAEMPLAKLRSGMSKFPQVLVNVRFAEGKDPLTSSAVQQEVAAVEQELAGRGRVLLRKSGTEPLIRVMVEGEHEQQVRDMAERIAKQVESAF